MAKIDDIERRILNWVRWCDGGGGVLGYAGVDLGASEGSSSYREAVIPTSDEEASETDAALATLPAHLQQTVRVHYLGEFVTMRRQAEVLGCSVSTLHARITEIHRRVSAWLAERHAARQAERARVHAVSGRAPEPRRCQGILGSEFHEL